MGMYEPLILKFLSDNPDLGPSITELMKRLNISIEEAGPTLDSLFNRRMVSMKIDNQGVERWFSATSGEDSFTSPESEPMQTEPIRPEPASASMPTTSFAELSPEPRGVSGLMFILGLLIMGAAAAWIGGKYISGNSVKAAARDKVDKKDFSEAVVARNLYETKAGDRLIALENKSKEIASVTDSLKAVQLRLKKLTLVVDSLKAAQAKSVKKGRRR